MHSREQQQKFCASRFKKFLGLEYDNIALQAQRQRLFNETLIFNYWKHLKELTWKFLESIYTAFQGIRISDRVFIQERSLLFFEILEMRINEEKRNKQD